MGKFYCTECGAELDDSSQFCPQCGKPVNNEEPENNRKPVNSVEPVNNDKGIELKINGNNIINFKKDGNNSNKIIIFALVGVIILLGIGILSSGVLTPKIPLKTVDFGDFEMDLPEGSKFEVYNSNKYSYTIIYENNGKYSEEINGFSVHAKSTDPAMASDLIEETDNMKLFQIAKDLRERSGKNYYELIIEKDGLYFNLSGEDANLLKQVAETIVVK